MIKGMDKQLQPIQFSPPFSVISSLCCCPSAQPPGQETGGRDKLSTSYCYFYGIMISYMICYNSIVFDYLLKNICCFYRFYFDFSATYVGVGMICPYIVNVSLLLGGIISWGVMWPLISTKKGSWYPKSLSDSSLQLYMDLMVTICEVQFVISFKN